MIILKVTRKQCFPLYLEHKFLKKPQNVGGGEIDLPLAFLELTNTANIQTYQHLISKVSLTIFKLICIGLLLQTEFPKSNNKRYFLSAPTGQGTTAIFTVSTITHYSFLGDLHIFLFILLFSCILRHIYSRPKRQSDRERKKSTWQGTNSEKKRTKTVF